MIDVFVCKHQRYWKLRQDCTQQQRFVNNNNILSNKNYKIVNHSKIGSILDWVITNSFQLKKFNRNTMVLVLLLIQLAFVSITWVLVPVFTLVLVIYVKNRPSYVFVSISPASWMFAHYDVSGITVFRNH